MIRVTQSAPMTQHQAHSSAYPVPEVGPEDYTIEALRGWAALMVMATHYTYLLTPQAGLWGFASTGVDLFFVLSGYVFAPYLFGKPLRLGPHLVRRFFRLYPLYLCALLLYAGLRLPASNAWEHFGVHLFMGHTLTSLSIANFYNPAFWSLPPEVEYYLLLPVLAWVATRLRFVWLLLLAIAFHLMLVAAAAPDEGVTARAIATVHAPGLLGEFMLGSLAYAMARGAKGVHAKTMRLVLGALVLVGMGWLYGVYIVPVSGVASPPVLWVGGNIGLGAALGYALLVSAVASAQPQASGPIVMWLRPWFVLMGQLSYGVYLLHNAAPQILARLWSGASGSRAVLLCIGITLLLAFALHHLVERPLRNYGRRLSHQFTG